jgi:carboxylesterase type B
MIDQENSNLHKKAILSSNTKSMSTYEKVSSDARKALASLKCDQRDRLKLLFINTQAIVKNNRPLKDYRWFFLKVWTLATLSEREGSSEL